MAPFSWIWHRYVQGIFRLCKNRWNRTFLKITPLKIHWSPNEHTSAKARCFKVLGAQGRVLTGHEIRSVNPDEGRPFLSSF